MKYKFLCIFFLINLFNHFNHFYSQDCKILGKTEPFSFVVIQGSALNTISNELGEFELNRLLPGLYNIEISAVGFKNKIIYEVETTISRPAYITANLQPLSFNLNEAEIINLKRSMLLFGVYHCYLCQQIWSRAQLSISILLHQYPSMINHYLSR